MDPPQRVGLKGPDLCSRLQAMECTGPDVANRLQALRDHLTDRRDILQYCGDHFAFRYYALTIPCLVLTICVSVISAAWPDDCAPAFRRVLSCLLGTAATVMISIMTLMKYQSKMDMFYNAAACGDELVSRLDFNTQYVFGSAKSLEELDLMALDIGKKIAEIRSCAPPIPMELELKARTLINKGMEEKLACEVARSAVSNGELPLKPEAPPSGGSTPPVVLSEAISVPRTQYEDAPGGDAGVEHIPDVNVLTKVRPLEGFSPCSDSAIDSDADAAAVAAEAGVAGRPDKMQPHPSSWDAHSNRSGRSTKSNASNDTESRGDWTL